MKRRFFQMNENLKIVSRLCETVPIMEHLIDRLVYEMLTRIAEGRGE